MKKINCFIKILVITICIVPFLKIEAFSDTITIGNAPYRLTLDSEFKLKTGGDDICTDDYPCFWYKNSSSGTAICSSGLGVDNPNENSIYKKDTSFSQNEKDRIVTAYIINLINKDSADLNTKFYWQEILVLGYLKGTLKKGTLVYNKIIAPQEPYTILNTGMTYKGIIEAAQAYYDNEKYKATISVDKQTVTFTKNEDGNYYSDEITVTSNSEYSTPSLNNTNFEVIKTGTNKYKFKISKDKVKMGVSQSFESDIVATSKYNVSQQYVCDTVNSTVSCNGKQAIILTALEEQTSTSKVTVTGTILESYASIEVNKVDDLGKKIANVSFMLQTEKQKNDGENGIIKSTTASSNLIFDNLTAGIYYLTETKPLSGYNKNINPIKIVIASDGELIVDGVKQTENIIKIINTKTKTIITKKSAVDGSELSGATLKILNTDNEVISCSILKSDGTTQDLAECQFVSGEDPIKIVGLFEGKYKLQELEAPEGYELNNSIIEFEVKADGTTTNVEIVNELEVEVPDTLSSRSALLLAVAMFDIALGIGIITYAKKNRIEE